MLNPLETAATLGEVAALAALPEQTLAYIGPGAGLGAILLVAALAIGGVLLLVGLVWYPLKRFLRSRSSAAGEAATEAGTEAGSADAVGEAATADAGAGTRPDEDG